MTAAVVVTPEDPYKKPPPVIHVGVINLNYKRSKEETALVATEMERLHAYIKEAKELEWAKERVERLQELILSPDVTKLKKKITEQSNGHDEG